MELRRLRLLHEFAQRGTVAAVAQALGYSPSSVSVQLGQLEREAGVALLRKAGRNVELTQAGHRLAEHATAALAADEAVRSELAALESQVRGSLRMAFVQTPALALLPGVLDHLARSAPHLEVEVVQSETAAAIRELRSGAVDLVVGIEYGPLPVARTRDVHRQDVLHEDVLLTRRRDPLAPVNPGPVSLASCEHETWACGQPGSGLDALLRNVCNRLAHFEPDVRHRSDDGLILSALVASGRAVALLPALLVSAIPTISAVPVVEEPLQRTIFAATRTTIAHSPSIVVAQRALHDTAVLVAGSQPEGAGGEPDLRESATERPRIGEMISANRRLDPPRNGERTKDGRVIGIEVKAASTVSGRDVRWLAQMRDGLGDRFVAGFVLHTGPTSAPFGDRIVALPISALWVA